MASFADSTLKQYSSVVNQWEKFCKSKGKECNIEKSLVMQFLVYKFDKGAQYSTLNTIRSALSLISSEKIGKDREIKRLMKGFFRSRPQTAKYTETWDPNIVLRHLANFFPLIDLNVLDLTKKAVTLIALSTGQRAQTILKIKCDAIQENDKGLRVKIVDIIKTSGPRRDQPVLEIPFFREKPELCVASTVLEYLRVTEKYRNNIKNVFLSTKSPFKAAGAQTVARWIKST